MKDVSVDKRITYKWKVMKPGVELGAGFISLRLRKIEWGNFLT